MQAFVLHDDDDKTRITHSVWVISTPAAFPPFRTPLSLNCPAPELLTATTARKEDDTLGSPATAAAAAAALVSLSQVPKLGLPPRFCFLAPRPRPAPCPDLARHDPPSRLTFGENHAAAPSEHPWIGSRRMPEAKGCKDTRQFKTLNLEVDRGIGFEMKRIFHRFRHYPACAVDGVAANLFGLPKLSQPSTAPSTASTLSGFLTASHEPDEMRSELGIAFVPTRSSSLPSPRCHIASSWQ